MKVINGIGYSTHSKAAFMSAGDGDEFKKVGDDFTVQNEITPWVLWNAQNNSEPVDIKGDIENTPSLRALIEVQARLAVGKGIDAFLMVDKDNEGNEKLEWVDDNEINDWLEENETYSNSYKTIYNSLAYGWAATNFVLSLDRKKINRIQATDIYTARLQKKDAEGYIRTMYLHPDWPNVVAMSKQLIEIPVLQECDEYDDLINRKDATEYAILQRIIRNGAQYYPAPPHRSSAAWVKITRAVPAFKNFLMQNQMSIKYVVTISMEYFKKIPGYTTATLDVQETMRSDVYDNIDKWLVGQANAGKAIFASDYVDQYSHAVIPELKIEVLDDKMKDGKYLPDSAAADKQILFSGFFNPAIIGANLLGDGASGGAGSGSDIREAVLTMMMKLHPERQNNLRIYNLVKKYNGWGTKLEKERPRIMPVSSANDNPSTTKTMTTPRLVFRYSSSILQTLDKGGSIKPVTN
jgi:hypothetical protein